VGFLFDTGDEGACFSVSASLERLLVMFFLATSETLTGWGGSGREGKDFASNKLKSCPPKTKNSAFSLLSLNLTPRAGQLLRTKARGQRV
jgi:hypothetical protein